MNTKDMTPAESLLALAIDKVKAAICKEPLNTSQDILIRFFAMNTYEMLIEHFEDFPDYYCVADFYGDRLEETLLLYDDNLDDLIDDMVDADWQKPYARRGHTLLRHAFEDNRNLFELAERFSSDN